MQIVSKVISWCHYDPSTLCWKTSKRKTLSSAAACNAEGNLIKYKARVFDVLGSSLDVTYKISSLQTTRCQYTQEQSHKVLSKKFEELTHLQNLFINSYLRRTTMKYIVKHGANTNFPRLCCQQSQSVSIHAKVVVDRDSRQKYHSVYNHLIIIYTCHLP